MLAGDAIKSVKPYFGLGVNTAFEDCIALNRCVVQKDSTLSQTRMSVENGWESFDTENRREAQEDGWV